MNNFDHNDLAETTFRQAEQISRRIAVLNEQLTEANEIQYQLERALRNEQNILTRDQLERQIKQKKAEIAKIEGECRDQEQRRKQYDLGPLHRALGLINHSEQEATFEEHCLNSGFRLIHCEMHHTRKFPWLFLDRLIDLVRLPPNHDPIPLHISSDLSFAGSNPWEERFYQQLGLTEASPQRNRRNLANFIKERKRIILFASHDPDPGNSALRHQLIEFWHNLRRISAEDDWEFDHLLLFYLQYEPDVHFNWPEDTILLRDLGASYTDADLAEWFRHHSRHVPDEVAQPFRRSREFVSAVFRADERDLDRVIERMLANSKYNWNDLKPLCRARRGYDHDWGNV